MKKNFKRTLAKVMAVALTIALAGTSASEADAAKKIKLSSKSITVTKGKTKKVTIKNVTAKKVKKLTVKSSKKSVATVKKSGKTALKVTGKKVGSATITATVKVTGKKKATKLTLKVKVKAATPTATKAPVTPVPTVAPTAAASTSPSVAPSTEPSADPSATPSDAPSADPSVAPSTEPSTEPQFNPQLTLTKENAPEWATSGDYGVVDFNADGTVSYESKYAEPKQKDDKTLIGSVYNNGLAFYVSPDKAKVDVQSYQYVAITVKTDAEVKLMTWSGAADATDYWSKNDIWGGSTKTIENEDGSKTIVYKVASVFKKPEKAISIGFTLKSGNPADPSKPDDATEFENKTATVYGIEFMNTIPGEDPEPIETPDPGTDTSTVETPEITFSKGIPLTMAALASLSDVDITADKDSFGNDTYKLNFTKKNDRVFFEIPETVDLSEVVGVQVIADSDIQLTTSLFDSTFVKDGQWWNLAKASGYPFYAGSGERAEDGGLIKRGVESNTTDTLNKATGNGGYFSIAANETVEEDTVVVIYGIVLVMKPDTKPADGISINVESASAELSDVNVTASTDEYGTNVYKLNFTKKNDRVFFEIPETVDLSKLTGVEVIANSDIQLTTSLFDSTFVKDGQWWNLAKASGYPFYAGSGERAEDGGLIARGVEKNVLDTTEKATGNGGYFSIAANETVEEDTVVEIYSITLIMSE